MCFGLVVDSNSSQNQYDDLRGIWYARKKSHFGWDVSQEQLLYVFFSCTTDILWYTSVSATSYIWYFFPAFDHPQLSKLQNVTKLFNDP